MTIAILLTSPPVRRFLFEKAIVWPDRSLGTALGNDKIDKYEVRPQNIGKENLHDYIVLDGLVISPDFPPPQT
ncbi:hypothetical protein RUM44_009096 [Polyplax serrata]|uniref:Uncharacterized protein n=1 Tax=Polyplax serrata TaxID=468196 RepID=A0ABR1ARQ9_POLSC